MNSEFATESNFDYHSMVNVFRSKFKKGYQLVRSEDQTLKPDRNEMKSPTTDDGSTPAKVTDQRQVLSLRLFEDAEQIEETVTVKSELLSNRKRTHSENGSENYTHKKSRKTATNTDSQKHNQPRAMSSIMSNSQTFTNSINSQETRKIKVREDLLTPSSSENQKPKDSIELKLAQFKKMDKEQQLLAVYEKLLNLESVTNRIEEMCKQTSHVRTIEQQIGQVRNKELIKENQLAAKSTINTESTTLIPLLRKLPAQSVSEIEDILRTEEAETSLVDYFCSILPDNHTYSDKVFLTLMSEKLLSKLLWPSKRANNKKKDKQFMPASVIRIYEAVTIKFAAKRPWYTSEKMNTHIRIWLSNRRDVTPF